jgi:hypothetical protein
VHRCLIAFCAAVTLLPEIQGASSTIYTPAPYSTISAINTKTFASGRVRLVFDQPQSIKRIRFQFNESEVARTQEFSVRWSGGEGDPLKEVVRQQWNFSPHGSEIESEDYQVDLKAVSILELTIDPDLGAGEAAATLADWRLA